MIVYASFARRLWAFILDIVLDLIVLGGLSAVTGGENLGGIFLFWYLIHHVGFVVEGGTLGHRLAGLRVVSTDGERVGVVMAFVRLAVLVCGSLPPLGLGALWMLDERDRRGWHDLAAGTVVVRELTTTAASAPVWAAAPPWQREPVPPAVPAAVAVPAEPASPHRP